MSERRVSLFKGLQPYTWYDIYVLPFSRNVEGASSTIVRERTKEDGNFVVIPSLYIQGGPKKVSHHQFFKKSPTRLDFFVKLKYESSTIIQSVGNKYSVRDLLL